MVARPPTFAAVVITLKEEPHIRECLEAAVRVPVAAGAYVAFVGFIGGAAWRVEFIADWQTVLQG